MNKQERYYDYLKHRFPHNNYDWLQDVVWMLSLFFLWNTGHKIASGIVFLGYVFGMISYVNLLHKLEKKAGVYYDQEWSRK